MFASRNNLKQILNFKKSKKNCLIGINYICNIFFNIANIFIYVCTVIYKLNGPLIHMLERLIFTYKGDCYLKSKIYFENAKIYQTLGTENKR